VGLAASDHSKSFCVGLAMSKQNESHGHIEFDAVIKKTGINPYIDLPDKACNWPARRGHVPVRGSLNGIPIRSTLVPLRGGSFRLYINTGMRTAAAVSVGDRIHLVLEIDPEPRLLPLPRALEAELEETTGARETWERLAPSRRKEILAYLNSLKTEEALLRNVKRVLDQLLGRDHKGA
jgi:hypothetical protein